MPREKCGRARALYSITQAYYSRWFHVPILYPRSRAFGIHPRALINWPVMAAQGSRTRKRSRTSGLPLCLLATRLRLSGACNLAVFFSFFLSLKLSYAFMSIAPKLPHRSRAGLPLDPHAAFYYLVHSPPSPLISSPIMSAMNSGWRSGPRPSDEPVDLSGDGGVLKTVLRPGYGYNQQTPPPHSYCKVAFVMKTSTGQLIANRMKKPMEFMLVRSLKKLTQDRARNLTDVPEVFSGAIRPAWPMDCAHPTIASPLPLQSSHRAWQTRK